MSKPFFSTAVMYAGLERTLPPCGSVRFYSVTGTVSVRFGESDAVPVASKDCFEVPFPLTFDKVTVIVAAGSAAVVNYGIGSQSGGSAGSSGSGGVQPTSGNPEGVLDAANGQWAFDAVTGFGYVNTNSSGAVGWSKVF